MQTHTKTTALEKHESVRAMETKTRNQMGGRNLSLNLKTRRKKKKNSRVSWFFWNSSGGSSVPDNEGPTGTTGTASKLSCHPLAFSDLLSVSICKFCPGNLWGLQESASSWWSLRCNSTAEMWWSWNRWDSLDLILLMHFMAICMPQISCEGLTHCPTAKFQPLRWDTLHWIIKSPPSTCLSCSPWWECFFSYSSHRLSFGVSQVVMMLPRRGRAAFIQWPRILLLS